MLKQPNVFYSQPSTVQKEALAMFYISTPFIFSFMVSSTPPTRSLTSYAYLITKIGNCNLKYVRLRLLRPIWRLSWTNIWNFWLQIKQNIFLNENVLKDVWVNCHHACGSAQVCPNFHTVMTDFSKNCFFSSHEGIHCFLHQCERKNDEINFTSFATVKT